jgi:hypothetical protein
MAEEPSFPDMLIEIVAKVGVIQIEGADIIIPDVNPVQMAMEKLSDLIDSLGDARDTIANTIVALEDNVVAYNNSITKIPQLGGLERDLPSDLIDNYRKTTIQIKESGILSKMQRGEKLTVKEQLVVQNWKNLKATKDFLSQGSKSGPDLWQNIEMLHDVYKQMIDTAQIGIQTLNIVSEQVNAFIATANGVRDYLEQVLKMPKGSLDIEKTIEKISLLAARTNSLIGYVTTSAFSLDQTTSTVLTNAVAQGCIEVGTAIRESVSEAKEKGVEVPKETEKTIAELETEIRSMKMEQKS